MNYRRVALLFLSLAALIAAGKAVNACECSAADETVLSKFEKARFVIVARVVSVEKASKTEIIHRGNEEVKETEMVVGSTRMVVEKVYKGSLKAGDGMTFGQGKIKDCLDDFDEDAVGTELLLYLNPEEKNPKVWYAEDCGKTKALPAFNYRWVANAADDLLYLEKMDQVSGRTRISGTLISYQWSRPDGGADFKRITGRKVIIAGEQKTYEAETNEDGVYEIYDLPPGRYTIQPESPKGWKIDVQSAFGGFGSGSRQDNEQSQVTLKEGRHAYFNFFFKVDDSVRGRVFAPSGEPMGMVPVDLLPAQGEGPKNLQKSALTDKNGFFEINEIPFGSYIIVVNKADLISARAPFRRFYYPDVHDRRQATVITISEKTARIVADIRTPEAKSVSTIQGVLLSSNGNPVVHALVYFNPEKTDKTETEKTDELIDGVAFAMTDEKGGFSIKVLKGMAGQLTGLVHLNEQDFKDCPQIITLLKGKSNPDWQGQASAAAEVQTQNNVDYVELRLSFPSCKDEKIFSGRRVD